MEGLYQFLDALAPDNALKDDEGHPLPKLKQVDLAKKILFDHIGQEAPDVLQVIAQPIDVDVFHQNIGVVDKHCEHQVVLRLRKTGFLAQKVVPRVL